ncbi:membrane fusion protein, Cu(I)/Ag(I) efflux system/membrane fusion protein, cobalt-zinc-cadmium efflux system [Fodinibius salinus]|uniref:Membrane fusion protein, Cu(I)/Ag(I) efflux system/membrane fusion protein, cobalt-zinc-cadmium efflux system n=1 Tax=Fodinibius salinus TaxID=860790 RepID=A0A5D3YJH6_9BACT|nr:efflux RND transporter periplasmic adaptor subunit [Fodinibius salinus]TYP93600.1 membrane fusion protein, Cu(I)/Ag(I) efflux system/membrane fusion protein, cobalt-zinc-cadmium efflux system [Fodinibius salinus]
MNTKSILLSLGVIAIFTLGGYWLGTQTTNASASNTQPVEEMQHQEMQDTSKSDTKNQEDREILYWQAPMNPSEIYDEPGQSKMGMDLVPVYADEANSSEGMVKINPVVVQNMNVRTAKVQQKDLSTVVSAVGKVEYDEQKLFNVNPKISGWVEKLHVDYTGKMVERGQPLFNIYSPELVTTQREYLLALKTQDKVSTSSFESIRDGGNSLLNATRKRLDYWDIPASEIEQLEQTGEIKKAVTLKSPASGVVVHKNAVEGEFIKAGTPAYKIADLSTVWVQASVYDYEVPWIKEGQSAQMELSYQPGKTYRGSIAYVYPSLDQKTRTVQVRLEFPNPNLELKPGMFANVRIQTHPKSNVIVIPNEAIIRTGERNIVFVAKGEGAFEPREVMLGMEGGPRNNEIEILEGVKPGEEIVTSAQFLFDSESRLQEAIQKMLQQKTSSPDKEMQDMDMSGEEMNHEDMPVDTTDHSNMNM